MQFKQTDYKSQLFLNQTSTFSLFQSVKLNIVNKYFPFSVLKIDFEWSTCTL